jgi:DNA-binding NarL/FixJ family response regulator
MGVNTKWSFAGGTYERLDRVSSHSTTASAAPTIAWANLSPRSTAILRQVAIPISAGYLPSEIARDLKTSVRWISERLDELRGEIERQRR